MPQLTAPSARKTGCILLVFVTVVAIVRGNAGSAQVLPVQAAPRFEVASIKRNIDNRTPLNVVALAFLRGAARGARNGRFTMQGISATTLHVLLQVAYDLKEFQIRGGPEWVRSDRYDIDARAGAAEPFEQMRPMLQTLLAERFNLAVSRDSRQLPVYELVAAAGGLRLPATTPGSCVTPEQAKPFGTMVCGGWRRQILSPSPDRRDLIEAAGVSMPQLVALLADELDRPVIDRTGFTGMFNVRLEFASTIGLDSLTPGGGAGAAPSLFTALEEQLGLRLVSATGPVDVLTIERVDRPSEN